MTAAQRLNTQINEMDELLLASVIDGNIKKVTSALSMGADIETHELNEGRTPLHIACLQRHLAIVRQLLHHGADVNSLNFCELTPLFETAMNGNVDIARVLIQHGADWRAVDNDGNAALSYTIMNPNVAVFDYLIELGADVKEENFYGRTILDNLLKFPGKNAEHGKLALRLYEMMGLDPAKSRYKRRTLDEYLADSPEALHVLREYIAKQICSEIENEFGDLNEVGESSPSSTPPHRANVPRTSRRPPYALSL